MNPKSLLNDVIGTIPPSGIRKFFDLASSMEGVISLGVGEPDFDTPWHIREEAIYAIEKGRHFIPPMPDCRNCARRSAVI